MELTNQCLLTTKANWWISLFLARCQDDWWNMRLPAATFPSGDFRRRVCRANSSRALPACGSERAGLVLNLVSAHRGRGQVFHRLSLVFWTMFDQGIFALANFSVNVMFARSLN